MNDSEWLRKMAEKEDGCIISVGGFVQSIRSLPTELVSEGSYYRHHKGGLYTILVVGKMESAGDSGPYMVVYRAIDEECGKVWIRALSEFTELIRIDRKAGPVYRFNYVDPLVAALECPGL